MFYDTEDPIVVNPEREQETPNNENGGSSVLVPQAENGQVDPNVVVNEKKNNVPEFNKQEIIKIVAESPEFKKAIEDASDVKANPELAGTENDLTGLEVSGTKYKIPSGTNVQANPTLAGTESELTGLEVGDTKYKVPQPTPVEANPTLAGTESALEGLKVGDTKYKVNQPTEVVANPTLAGTEAALEGLQVGNTKYKVGGGSALHCYRVYIKGSSTPAFEFLYYTDGDNVTNSAAFYDDLIRKGFESSGGKKYVLNGANIPTDGKLYIMDYVAPASGNFSPGYGRWIIYYFEVTLDVTNGTFVRNSLNLTSNNALTTSFTKIY